MDLFAGTTINGGGRGQVFHSARHKISSDCRGKVVARGTWELVSRGALEATVYFQLG